MRHSDDGNGGIRATQLAMRIQNTIIDIATIFTAAIIKKKQ